MTTVLEEIGIDLDKLQEIPLPSDPDEQALERQKQAAIRFGAQRYMDGRARAHGVELVRCDWDSAVFAQTQIRARLVRGTIGVLACPEHAQRTPAEWIAHFQGKKR